MYTVYITECCVLYKVHNVNTPKIHPIEKLTFLSTNPNKTKSQFEFVPRDTKNLRFSTWWISGVWPFHGNCQVKLKWRECVFKWLMSWLKMTIELTCNDYTGDLGRLRNWCHLTLELTFETCQGNPSSNDNPPHVSDISRRDTGFWSLTREKACSNQYTLRCIMCVFKSVRCMSIHLTWHDYWRDLWLNNHYSPDFWYLHTFISAYIHIRIHVSTPCTPGLTHS